MTHTLLERDEALASIRRAVQGAQANRGQALFVVGEAGIGKTALLREGVSALATGDGPSAVEVATVLGDEMEMVLPFAAVVRLLETLGERHLVDGIVNAHLPVAEPAAPLYRLGRWLDGRSGRPTVLVVDDLHWTDADSRLALGFLVRRLASTSVSIVATMRPWPEEALELARALAANAGAELVSLEPLTEAAAAELLQARSGVDVPTLVQREAWHLCGGNPLLIEQVAPAVRRGESLPGGGEQLTGFGRSILLSRFAGVDRLGLEVARVASVLGTRFRVEVAAEIAGVREAEIVAVLRGLTRTGLVVGDGGGQRFAHPLFAQALYDDIGPLMRSHLHGRCFAELMRRGLESEAVAHVSRAGLTGDPDAIAALAREGRAALDAGAVATARLHLGTAVSLSGPNTDPSLLLAYAEALGSSGEMEESAAVLRRVLAVADLPWDVRSEGWRMLGRALYLTGSPDHGGEAFSEAVALAVARDPQRAVRAMLDQSLSAWLAGGCTLALPIAERARDLSRSAPVPLRERVEATWAHLALDAGNPEGFDVSDALLRRILTSRAGGPDPSDGAWPWASPPLLANNAVHAERFDEAEAALAMARDAAERSGTPNAIAVLLIYTANLAIRRGRLAEALELAARAVSYSELTPGVVGYGAVARAEALLWQGDLPAAEAACREVEQSTVGQWFAQFWLGHVRGLRLLWEGDPAASDHFRSVERAGSAAGIGEPCLMLWAAHAIEAHVLAGRPGDAQRVTAWLEERRSTLPCRFPRIAAHVGRAHLAWTGREPERALSELQSALALHGEVDLPLHRVEALLTYGRFLRVLGRSVESRSPLGDAAALAERQGASWLAAQARAELALAGGRRRRSSHDPAELTNAQRRVARLAAEGRSNAEIAAMLFVSVTTVETHLKHLFAKLGIRSRRELTAARLASPRPVRNHREP